MFIKLYENKWFLYEENSNNINEFGDCFMKNCVN